MNETMQINGLTYVLQTGEKDKDYVGNMLEEFLEVLVSEFTNNLRASYLVTKAYQSKEFSALQVEAQANYAAVLAAYNTMAYCFEQYENELLTLKQYDLKQVTSYEQLTER